MPAEAPVVPAAVGGANDPAPPAPVPGLEDELVSSEQLLHVPAAISSTIQPVFFPTRVPIDAAPAR